MDGSPENLYKAMLLQPSAYLPDSADGHAVRTTLSRLERYHQMLQRDLFFSFKCEGEHQRIPYADISYFESSAKKVMLHSVRDGKRYCFAAKLDDLAQGLPSCFLRCHQSYLVNMHMIRSLDTPNHDLSSASIFEDYLSVDMDDVTYRLTVERFNEMIAPLAGQTLQTCRRALDEAGVKASEVSAVLMVGGTSRIPLVREMARKITGSPVQCVADLELAVAQGALDYRQFEQKKRREAEEKVQREKAEQEAEKARKKAQEAEAQEKERQETVAKEVDYADIWYRKGLAAEGREAWTESAECYRKAAELGHIESMYNMGVCYEDGEGVKQESTNYVPFFCFSICETYYTLSTCRFVTGEWFSID